jgi:hypothetical protein
MVPIKLITPVVNSIANMIVEDVNKTESEISDLHKGKERDNKENYIKSVWSNVRNLPYTSNGLINDSYMVKYNKIIKEFEERVEKTKPKVRKTRKPKVDVTTKPKENTSKVDEETTTVVVKGKRGKNNNLIFGK